MTTSEAPTCPKHPREVTYLRCAACNVPICSKCSVETPVGYKCKGCGHHREALYAPSVGHMLAGVGVALVAGILGNLVGFIGFWGIWIALFYGRSAGTLILKAAGGRSSLLLEVFAVIAILAGGLGARASMIAVGLHVVRGSLQAMLQQAGQNAVLPPELAYVLSFFDPFIVIILIAVSAGVVSRLRWSWSYWGM